ncbi:MAG: DUF3341 domain-containing protein [Planctomycetes bacterium]|nr:DUF3341 domain-containing protein [Planctomycetota bacterium]MBI3845335.1 DUF3341 domain-containing protein [Planctomycetota bacterium]
MKRHLLIGVFENEESLVAATRATREAGYPIHDVFAPYAVHGLDQAMGLRPSRLPWICLSFAIAGLLLAAGTEFWMGSIDWPLNVGGKPLNSLPAYLPVMFELMVLIGGVGTALTLFVVSRLYPGKKEWLPDPRVTNGRFVLALDAAGVAFDADRAEQLLHRFEVAEVRTLQEG